MEEVNCFAGGKSGVHQKEVRYNLQRFPDDITVAEAVRKLI